LAQQTALHKQTKGTPNQAQKQQEPKATELLSGCAAHKTSQWQNASHGKPL
jgi:hypothetical protein